MNGVSIFARGRILWAKIKGPDGARRNVSTKLPVGEEEKARRWALALSRRFEAERKASGGKGPLTVAAYAATWLEKRRATVDDWKNDQQRLTAHVLPAIGHLHVADVDAAHLAELFGNLRAAGKLAARTIYNVYSVVAALFRDARLARLITQTPCVLTSRELGPKVDKDPTQRGEAVFDRREAAALVSDPRIPLDRRVVYALETLAGLRHGEVAGLRWRHLDPTREPLGMLTVATSYDKGKTKTGVVRRVPIHPTLAELLREWAGQGWPAMFGKTPTPHDLVVPLEPEPKGKRGRRNPRSGGIRSKNDSRKRWLRDLATLGLRHRRGHDLRATFITLAEDDGADPAVIASLTHTGKARDAVEGYRRKQWETKCREVAKLAIALVEPVGGVGTSWVQSAESSTITDGNEWRRRESNTGAAPLGAGRRKSGRAVSHRRVSPNGAAPTGTVPTWVHPTRCDVGLLALMAVGQGARAATRGSR